MCANSRKGIQISSNLIDIEDYNIDNIIFIFVLATANTFISKLKTKAIVFFSTRDAVRYFELLFGAAAKEEGAKKPLGELPLFYLHGGATQQERTRAYFAFCKASTGALFCTDVAARGLDMPMVMTHSIIISIFYSTELNPLHECYPLTLQVKWIIQASPPTSIPEYIHRVGRTARMETSGSSMLMLMPNEVEFVSTLATAGVRLVLGLVLS